VFSRSLGWRRTGFHLRDNGSNNLYGYELHMHAALEGKTPNTRPSLECSDARGAGGATGHGGHGGTGGDGGNGGSGCGAGGVSGVKVEVEVD